MAEYIERETFLKDIAERYCLPCKEAGRDHNGCKCRACWVDDMRGDVIDATALENDVTVQEWISVKDRLPKDWTDVLVLSRFGFLETAVYTGAPGKWRVGWNGDMLEADSITHWMPLPHPTKGE